ncbi:MAG: hypothetical protein R3D57_10650 [Hyphomicrobiaceae bacterium]
MRIFETLVRMTVLTLALALTGPALAADTYPSPAKAYSAGLAAIDERDFETAFKALRFAADADHFYAKFVLAQLYASDALPYVDHVKAFHLFAEIADRYSAVDPYVDRESPYVARALVAVAHYQATGLPEMGLAADPERAERDLDYASTYFDDMDAQLELVKIWLKDKDKPGNFRKAKDLLLRLARDKGHPGAQATIAEMFFTGDTKLGRRLPLALGFAILAVEGAGDDDQLWIDSLYHQIYCATAPEIRVRANRIADRYRKDVRVVEAIQEARRRTAVGRITETVDKETWGRSLIWTCANGESVAWPKRSNRDGPDEATLTASAAPDKPTPAGGEAGDEVMGLGLAPAKPASAP